METNTTPLEILASGDNGMGQLWIKDIPVSPKFIKCTEFPLEPKDLLQVSLWEDSIAILSRDMNIYFKNGTNPVQNFSIGTIKRIYCSSTQVFCLSLNGEIISLPDKEKYTGSNYQSFSVSNTSSSAINSKGELFLFPECDGNNPKKIADNVIAHGCTDQLLFYSTSSALKCYDIESGEENELDTPAPIILISTSDTEALFVDENGALYQYLEPVIIQLFGVPPIIHISVGPQHFCAIGNDRGLYTWGFNPSGQLGYGNDRSSNEPILVLDNVSMAECGTHNTIVVQGGNFYLPSGLKFQLADISPSHSSKNSDLYRSEYLF